MAPVGILTEAALSDTWVVRGRAAARKMAPESRSAPVRARGVGFKAPFYHLICLCLYLSVPRKTADYHLIRLLRRMQLRNKFLSPKCAPDSGDVDTYFFFEKIFRSEIRMCVTVTYFFEVRQFLVLFTHSDCDRRLLRRMALRNKFLSPTCPPDLGDVGT